MTTWTRVVLWAPRIVAVVLAAFLAMFALDAFDAGLSLEAFQRFAAHLVPAAGVLAIVAITWRVQWLATVAFLTLAVLYGAAVRSHVEWILSISGPLTIVAVLFFMSSRLTRRARSGQ